MHRHPYFDLWLHETDELGEFLDNAVIGRATLHEWPLSCVQRLTCADGLTFIYKVQAQPTVEPEFYQKASSSLLVASRVLPIAGMPAALLLEDVQAGSLEDSAPTSVETFRHVDSILAEIPRIQGEQPAIMDIHTPERWLIYAQSVIEDLTSLVECGPFRKVTRGMVEQITRLSRSSAVFEAIQSDSGYVHGDLCAENILVLENGYKVLDWQRPIRGPIALDRATLLGSLGLNIKDCVKPGVAQLRQLLLIGWFTQCALRWFPVGAATYDSQIAALIVQLSGN
jgi:hypothetical protein